MEGKTIISNGHIEALPMMNGAVDLIMVKYYDYIKLFCSLTLKKISSLSLTDRILFKSA